MTVEIERKTGSVKQFTGEGRGTAVLARLGVRDKDGDVLVPGLLGGEQQVPLIQAHDWQVPPFGRAVVRERGDELVADFTLNVATPRGREWAEVLAFDLAHGAIQQWSWGFSILPDGSEIGTHEGERVRLLRRIKLHEVSPVVVGASVGSRTLSLKDAEHREDPISNLIGALRTLDRAAITAYVESLPREQQEAWLTQAQGLVAEGQFLATVLAFDDLTGDEGKATAGAFRYKFVYLPPEDARRRAATAGLIAAAAELRSTEPSFRFFTEAEAGEQWDFVSARPLAGASGIPAYPGVVAVYIKLSPEQVLETIAHEVVHFARPGFSEAQVEEFAREIARKGDLRPALVPVPEFVRSEEARALRKRGYPVHYSPFLNAEYVLALRAVPTSPQPKAMLETAPANRLVPLSGLPMPIPIGG